ncbi:MAG: hypothetical protein AAGK97_07380, partial [Bacteroidota bacterium]
MNDYEYRLPNSNVPSPDGIPNCGGVLNNETWFSFVAAGGPINIRILPSNCEDVGNGPNAPNLDVQAALYEVTGSGCPNPTIDLMNVLCKDDCATTPQPITWNNVQTTRGQQYMVVVDGCSGDVCDLQFRIDGAGAAPFVLDEITDINGVGDGGTLQVCTGTADFPLTINGDLGSSAYDWSTPSGMVTTEDPELLQSFPITGDFQYCAITYTGCDSTDINFCITVEVRPAEDGETLDQTICEGDAFFWLGNNYSETGMYTAQFMDPVNSCIYDSFLNLLVYDENDDNPTMLDTSACWDDELFFGGEVIDRFNPSASWTIPSQQAPDCDSFLTMNVTFINVFAEVSEVTCASGDFIVFLNNIDVVPDDVDFEISWTNAAGVEVSNTDMLTTNVEGDYAVSISISRNEAFCDEIFVEDVFIDADLLLPNAAALIDGPASLCGGDAVQYSTPDIPNADQYTWRVTGGGNITAGQGDEEITVDWSNSMSGGDVCVLTQNDCGESAEICLPVTIVQEPTATFTMPQTACIEDAVTITYSGNAPANATYNWNFSGADIISGGTGQGPHQVRWPGGTTDRQVSLIVDVAGCTSEQVVNSITLDPALPPLTLNCLSSPDAITFSWNEIATASGYDVQIIFPSSGVSGTLNGTTYEIMNLMSGDSVAVQITTMSSNSCENTVTVLGCIAKECENPMLSIDSIPPICLDNAAEITLNAVFGNPNFPTGTSVTNWSSSSGG